MFDLPGNLSFYLDKIGFFYIFAAVGVVSVAHFVWTNAKMATIRVNIVEHMSAHTKVKHQNRQKIFQYNHQIQAKIKNPI